MIPLDVPVELGREEARRRVLEELDKAKYGGMPQWLEALLDRLFEWLRRIVEFVLEAGAGPRAVGGGINFGFLIILLVILAGIALVVWKVGLPRWRGRRPRGAEVELAADVEPEGYRAAAEQYAAAGDWRSAVRDRFRAVIKELENATVLDPRPARTAFEASALAGRALPDQARALRSGAEIFSAVMYGDLAADAATYRRMAELDELITEAVRRADLAGDEPEPVGEPR